MAKTQHDAADMRRAQLPKLWRGTVQLAHAAHFTTKSGVMAQRKTLANGSNAQK